MNHNKSKDIQRSSEILAIGLKAQDLSKDSWKK